MKYGPDKTKEICDSLERGNNRTDTCLLCDINYDTFCEWMRKTEFSEAVKRAEAAFKQTNIAIIQKAAKDKSWQAAAWLLERKYRDEYALKLEPIKSQAQMSKESMDAALSVLKVMEEAAQNVANARRDRQSHSSSLDNGSAQVQAQATPIPGL